MADAQRVDEFLDTYKRLEEAVRTAYGIEAGDSPVFQLARMKRFERLAGAIDCCREVRNFLQHTPKVAGGYAAEPSAELVEFMNGLIERVLDRPCALDIATRAADVVSCVPSDTVRSLIEKMHAEAHSSVPVLVDGRVVGVFDKDAVFTCIAERADSTLPLDAMVADLARFTALEGRRSESFAFCAKNEPLEEVEAAFDERSRAGRRVAVAFVTEHGKPEERILGLFTAWDIIAAWGK